MNPPVRLCGIGMARSPGDGMHAAEWPGRRLSAVLSTVAPAGVPVRLFHPIEEVTCLAAYEALSLAGVAVPLAGDGVGIALGVDEGIDGVKARYYQGVLTDGPLGASPMAFPFTTPNTIAARISILFDLRGESLTVCGGSLSGAQAIGLALEALRGGRCGAVLAGGATSVEPEFLEALRAVGRPDHGQPRCGACLLLLEPQASAGEAEGSAALLGYGEGFGRDEILLAVEACLEDAGLSPDRIGSARLASAGDPRFLVEELRRVGTKAPIVRSQGSDLYAASFPMALAEAARPAAGGTPGPILILGWDCLAGASAALVGVGGRP